MGIKKAFGGSSIRKPGAYSISKVDQSGGAPLGDNGTLFIIGEADKGAPGDVEGLKSFSSAQLADLIGEYGSGPIVDVARAALIPSRTPGVGGADQYIVWKTNSSTQAELDLDNASAAALIKMKDRNFGVDGNRIAVTVANGTDAAKQRIITIERDDTVEVLAQNEGKDQLTIQYTGAGTAAAMTVSGASEDAKTMVITVTGAASDDLSINLKEFTMKSLATFINAQPNYTATLNNTATGSITQAKEIDRQTATDVKTATVTLRRLQRELVDLVNANSTLALAELQADVGLPVVLTKTFMTGGAKGASTSADFSDGMAKSLAVDWNVAVPAISQDATTDITEGLTDSSSTYDIDSVTASLDSHLRLRGSVKNRKEAQGMVGRRDALIADSQAAAQTLGSELVQMWVDDVLVTDVDGVLKWRPPHVEAALCAGIRLGTEVGEPLTHKFLNCNGIGHKVNVTTGLSAGDFDASTDFDPAIDAGISFAERAQGGFRVVVDNTTYGKDQSFVWNRGSVVEASQFIAKTLRETAELVFVGQKVSNGIADSIKSVLTAKLLELNAANITTASDDGAPNGFVEDTFTVTVQGNTANVQVHVKPVQGLDFIFIEFTLGDIIQSA